jgi:hypothetical protein
MALSTYSELKTSIADWLNRSDLTSAIAGFITLAEAEFNRTVRVRQMITRANATIDSEYTQLPSDFLEMENLVLLLTTPTKLEYLSDEQADDYFTRYFSAAGTPRYYTIVGDTFKVVPSPGTDTTQAQMTYYSKIAALSDTNTSNWLLTKHPDLYLYGALLQSAPYLQDDNRIVVWNASYERGITSMKLEQERANYSGTTPRVRAKPMG